MRIAIVVARFNELVTRLLLAGALETAGRHGVAAADIEVHVDAEMNPSQSDKRQAALLRTALQQRRCRLAVR